MDKWLVYEHVSPSGKVYVGITKPNPKDRWKNGTGYLRKDNHQPLIANAIKKYGWDNFTHCIIASNLTLEKAAETVLNIASDFINFKYKRYDT